MTKNERLPYQETQAYRKVLHELQRAMRQKCKRQPDDSTPLICLSKKADKTKKVKQLYPPQNRTRKKSEEVKRFTDKIIASFKVSWNTRYTRLVIKFTYMHTLVAM